MLRHWTNPLFGGVIFRRTSTQVRNEGGLWDESVRLYLPLGAFPREYALEWDFPGGFRLKFAHLEHERNVYDWQGSQVPFIGFDELTHFTEKQFTYMMSRNRSTSGVPGYIRGTCNPDVDSWVRRWIDWWIGADGYPVLERSGVVRWFIRQDDAMIWGDSLEELVTRYGPETMPKSLTFIPSRLQDNQILMQKDPTYLANLRALPRVDRLRLEGGNWNVRASAGLLFQREWFPVTDTIPAGFTQSLRFWDRAATKPHEGNPDPDWTRGVKLLRYPDGRWVVADLKSIRGTPLDVEQLIRNTAAHDGIHTRIVAAQDPGSAGVAEADFFVRMLQGYDVRISKSANERDKITRSKPVSAQAEAGNVSVLRAPWNSDFFTELENFPEGSHDDIVDAFSGAYNESSGGLSIADAC